MNLPVDSILQRMRTVDVGVFGDFALDAYWHIDPAHHELSVETGLPVQQVVQQRYSLGGAANVVANLHDLGVASVQAIGMVGRDLFGHELSRQLHAMGTQLEGMISAQDDWQTLVFAKPMLGREEQPRLDFGTGNVLQAGTIDTLATQLDHTASQCGALILNQQVNGVLTHPALLKCVNEVIATHNDTHFVVDSRDCADAYRHAILKLNVQEAVRMSGEESNSDMVLRDAEVERLGATLCQMTGRPVIITRGERGLLIVEGHNSHHIPGIQAPGLVDPVGAGDTTIAALAAGLAAGCSMVEAAELANLAASVTVQKLHITGTASPQEILAAAESPAYVYEPELAEHKLRAEFIDHTDIEIVRPMPDCLRISHAIFDHDGTISTLREGWEQIMEPMMLRVIMGAASGDPHHPQRNSVHAAVQDFIERTTGIQTLAQMQGLADMVHHFGIIPTGEILDAAGYKQVYNEALLNHVNQRIARMQAGELCADDFLIKNAVTLLERLRDAGVKLYLASGTDNDDVVHEATVMGYAPLFDGGIYGAVGDVSKEAKRMVMQRIIRENQLDGPQFVTFGDGPVEMRAAHQCGGIAVGVASDELRRFGLNDAKRTRLIRAGADLVVPDFGQLGPLLDTLHIQH